MPRPRLTATPRRPPFVAAGALLALLLSGPVPSATAAPAKPSKPAAKPGAKKPAARPGATPAAKPAPKAADARPPKPKLPPTPPELLLTFDDGPHLERTPKVLATLEKHKLHAVFFVNGVHFLDDRPASRKAKGLLREMVARGHAVGNHTVHHYFLCGKVYSKRAEEEIEGNARLIEGAIGKRPELYRTPFGSHCPQLAEVHKKLGIKHTGWDIDPQDWKVQNTEKVRDFIINHLKNLKHGREILLMHDIHQCTVEALPQILDWIEQENAARIKRGELPIKIIDYAYLLPPHPAVPPILDGIGRILIDGGHLPDPSALLSLLTGRARSS